MMLFLLIVLLLQLSATLGMLAEYCGSAADAELLSTMFINCVPHHDNTNCPAEGWLSAFKKADLSYGAKASYTMVNIGCNKGYNFATWMNVFAPSWRVNASTWYEVMGEIPRNETQWKEGIIKLPRINKKHRCGMCRDCEVIPFKSEHDKPEQEPQLNFFGIDLNSRNIWIVNKTMSMIQQSNSIPQHMVNIKLLHAAAGRPELHNNTAGRLNVPVCEWGEETCKIPTNYSIFTNLTEFESAPIYTVDKLIRKLKVFSSALKQKQKPPRNQQESRRVLAPSQRAKTAMLGKRGASRSQEEPSLIDILHIDTEGNDAEVLKTAQRVLKAQRVRALVFEYHELLPWGNTSLQEVLQNVTRHEMDCYFMGQNRLWPITGTCWHPQWDFHKWSNILCLRRSDRWRAAVEALVVTAATLRGKFKDGDLIRARRESDVFLVRNGSRHGFTNKGAFVGGGFRFDDVKEVAWCEAYHLFPRGNNL